MPQSPFLSQKRKMARFSVGGDEDGNEDRPTNRPLPKRPRLPISLSNKRPAAAAANSRDRPTTSNAAANSRDPSTTTVAEYLVGRISQPEERVLAGEESERLSSDESETSWSDTSTDSSSTEEEEDIQQQPQQQTGGEVQLAEARADLIASGSDEGTSGSFSVTLSDPDVLDCPICYEPLCSPVYQVLILNRFFCPNMDVHASFFPIFPKKQSPIFSHWYLVRFPLIECNIVINWLPFSG